MDITKFLTYNNMIIQILDLKNSIGGWSISKQKYRTEKILNIRPIKTNTYFIINDIKFHINSQILIKNEDSIEEIFVKDLYDKFIENEEISILDYNLETVSINKFEFIEKASVRNYCTFVSLSLSENMLYVPYSEYSILIKGALFI